MLQVTAGRRALGQLAGANPSSYSSSVTGSAHSTVPPDTATCTMGAARDPPWKCHSSGPTWITSPGSSTYPASSRVRTRPRPPTAYRNCPAAWRCHRVRAPGEKCTTVIVLPPSPSVDRSHTSPVNRPSSPRSYVPSMARAISIWPPPSAWLGLARERHRPHRRRCIATLREARCAVDDRRGHGGRVPDRERAERVIGLRA